jgi:hypothetical protein
VNNDVAHTQTFHFFESSYRKAVDCSSLTLMSEQMFKIFLHVEGKEETKRAKRAKRARKPPFLPLLPFLPFLFPFAFQLKKMTRRENAWLNSPGRYAAEDLAIGSLPAINRILLALAQRVGQMRVA